MPNSYTLYNGNGATTDFTVVKPYLFQSHVTVEVSGVSVPFTWLSTTSVRCTTAPAVGTGNVKIKRTTPRSALVTFADGSGLVMEDLNTVTTQARYIAEEQEDAYLGSSLTDLSITTGLLADSIITSVKILDGAITTVKILDGAVTTAKIPDAAITNAKLANVATQTFKGRTTAATGVPEDLTVTQATALLNNVVGDSGAGGTKGLVPAAAAGDGAAKKALLADGTFGVPSLGSGYIYLREEQVSGTEGGATVATTWTKRTLNTEVADTGSHATTAASVMTLLAGTYRVTARVPAHGSQTTRLRLRNTSDSTTTLLGSTARPVASQGTHMHLSGRFTIAATKNFELQYFSTAVVASDGLGKAIVGAAETEIYAEIEFIRE